MRKKYDALMDSGYWKVVSTDSKTPDEVFCEVNLLVQEAIKKPKHKDIPILWPHSGCNVPGDPL